MESLGDVIKDVVSAQSVNEEIERLEHLSLLTSEQEPIDIEDECKNKDDMASDACLAQLICYLFPRRYGWKDNGRKVPKITAEQKHANKINELLDEIIEWFLEQPISQNLLTAYFDCIKKAANSPVVRSQTAVHVMQWMKECQQSDMMAFQAHFQEVVNIILLIITDIWSAIRKTCVHRLGPLLNYFSLSNVKTLFTHLIKICADPEASWQAVEGAVMAINAIVRKFHWKSTIDGLGIVDEEENTDQLYFLMFGDEELAFMPSFISDSLPDTVFSLLRHPQQTVREHAIKAYSAYISKCDMKFALAAFEQVIAHLRRGLEGEKQDIQAALTSPNYEFMDPFEAEGLLGVATNMVKHIPPQHLLPGWTEYMTTFSLYLMHPASTVRQTTSSIFKFIIAKDSSNPHILQRVLYGLCREWEPDTSALSQPQPDIQEGGTVPHPAQAPSITQVVGRQQDLPLSSTWQWREGRLLAYELILQFLIKNHWLYTFGAANLQVTPSPSPRDVPQQDSNSSKPGEDNTFNSGLSSSDRAFHRSSLKARSFHGHSNVSRHRTTSLSLHQSSTESSPSKPIEIVSGPPGSYNRRPRYSICSTKPTPELLAIQKKLASGRRDSTGMASSAGAMDLNSGSRQGMWNTHRLSTVGSEHPSSLKTLGRHFSYYTQGQESVVTQGQDRVSLPASTSLLLACQTGDISQGLRSSKVSKSEVSAQEAGEGEMKSLSELLELILYQTVESLGDPQWETRRMAQQLLPCVSEVLRWYDMGLLCRLWDDQLQKGTTLLTYGASLALKYSLVHAARLQHFLRHPPPQWQDAALCRAVIERITVPMATGIAGWSQSAHSLLQRPRYDKLTAAAMETVLLVHWHYSLKPDMRCGQLHRVVCVLREVFSKAHPHVSVDPEPRLLPKAFLLPTHGVFSCLLRPDGSLQSQAQQVEKCLLTETQHTLSAFLRLSDIHETVYLLPILCYYLGYYAADDTLLRNLSESTSSLIATVNKALVAGPKHEDDFIHKCCGLALSHLSSIMANKSLSLMLVRPVCDMYVHLCEHLSMDLHLPALATAINARLQAATPTPFRPLQRICSAPDNMVDSPLVPPLLLNGRGQNGHDEEEDTSDDDPQLDPAAEGHLAESQTLNTSVNSMASSASQHNDWDSDWDTEEEDSTDTQNQPAVTALFKELFTKLQTQQQKTEGSTWLLSSEVKRLKIYNVQKVLSLLETMP